MYNWPMTLNDSDLTDGQLRSLVLESFEKGEAYGDLIAYHPTRESFIKKAWEQISEYNDLANQKRHEALKAIWANNS